MNRAMKAIEIEDIDARVAELEHAADVSRDGRSPVCSTASAASTIHQEQGRSIDPECLTDHAGASHGVIK
jgi:hypothetical protein